MTFSLRGNYAFAAVIFLFTIAIGHTDRFGFVMMIVWLQFLYTHFPAERAQKKRPKDEVDERL